MNNIKTDKNRIHINSILSIVYNNCPIYFILRFEYQYRVRMNTQLIVTFPHKLINRPGGVFYDFAPFSIFFNLSIRRSKETGRER